jgi:hypothetical protein
MITPEIYFDRQRQIKVSLPEKCRYCEYMQYEEYFLFEKYAKSQKINNRIDVVCQDCLSKSNEEMILYDYWTGSPIKVVSNIDPSWTVLYFTPPSFKNSKNDMSIFEAANKQIGGEVITDNTVHSFRNQNATDSIGFEEARAKLAQRDLELLSSPNDPLSLLKDLQSNGVEQIENEKKRYLN